MSQLGITTVDFAAIVADKIKNALTKYRSDSRPCLGCGKSFKPTNDNHVFCDRACGRRSHYVSFSVRRIRESFGRNGRSS